MNNNLNETMTEIQSRIGELILRKPHVIIAIDGPSASGKTTLAKALSQKLSATVIHMDDFFLRPEQRTKERLSIPGGNVDRERFLQEVLIPLSKGKEYLYKPFDCHTMAFMAAELRKPQPVIIIEGSYSCHPDLFSFYDLRIFLEVDTDTQRKRIFARNGEEVAGVFLSKWIPLENKYIAAFDIENLCELHFRI